MLIDLVIDGKVCRMPINRQDKNSNNWRRKIVSFADYWIPRDHRHNWPKATAFEKKNVYCKIKLSKNAIKGFTQVQPLSARITLTKLMLLRRNATCQQHSAVTLSFKYLPCPVQRNLSDGTIMSAIIRTLESKTELDVQKDLKDAIEGSDLEVVHDEEVLVVAGLRQEFFGFNENYFGFFVTVEGIQNLVVVVQHRVLHVFPARQFFTCWWSKGKKDY